MTTLSTTQTSTEKPSTAAQEAAHARKNEKLKKMLAANMAKKSASA